MNIKQFSGTYFLNDDRIIFRFNTMDNNEYKFWLTRRVTHFILMITNQFQTKQYEESQIVVPAVAKAIAEYEQQAIKDTTNLATPYVPGNQYPMGADAILVIDARCEINKVDNEQIFSLDFILPGGGSINFKFPLNIMQRLALLLDQLNTQAQWGTPPNPPATRKNGQDNNMK